MSNQTNSIIPAHMQDIDPGVRQRIEQQLQDSGQINKTEYNPNGKMMFQNTGTPQKTEREIADAKIIAANREIKMQAEPLIKEVTDKVRSSEKRLQYIAAIKEALAAVDAAEYDSEFALKTVAA